MSPVVAGVATLAALVAPVSSRAWAQALVAPGAWAAPPASSPAKARALPPAPLPVPAVRAEVMGAAAGCAGPASVCLQASETGFPLVHRGRGATLVADPSDDAEVLRVVRVARDDLAQVGGQAGPLVETRELPLRVGRALVVVGTLGRSALVDRLVEDGKLDTRGVAGVWEGVVVEVVERPWAGVARALVVAGADPHGTIFGLYDLVAAAGVSPWAHWLDLPVSRHAEVSVTPGRRLDHPAVKVRGLSLNEDSPALRAWAKERFGGFVPAFRAKLFDLVLRLKGNVVWRPVPKDAAANEALAKDGVVPAAREGGGSHAGTRLFIDDGWGHLRALPPWGRARPGGAGIYLHLEGADEPRRDEWLDGTQLPQLWEQLTLAHEYGVAQIWVADVGRLATRELAASFFLEDAWAPGRMSLARMEAYPATWAAAQFGAAYGKEIGALLARHAGLAGRRRPAWLDADTYSVVHDDELARVLAEHRKLVADATALEKLLPPSLADAYFRLVLFPIAALANLHELHGAVALNRWYASQGRAATNRLAAEAEAAYARDVALTAAFHRRAGGAWDHLMDVPHLASGASTFEAMPDIIGASSPSGPPTVARLALPAKRDDDGGAGADLALAVEGDARAHLARVPAAVLPAFSTAAPSRVRWLEVFSRDGGPASVELVLPADRPWLTWRKLPGPADQVRVELRLAGRGVVGTIPPGTHRLPIMVRAGAREMTVDALIENPGAPAPGTFVEVGGKLAFEAAHASRVVEGRGRSWVTIPGLGKTGVAIAPFPRTVQASTPGEPEAPHLAYDVFLAEAGPLALTLTLAPTRDFLGQGGLRYAVSFDEQPPQLVNVHGHADAATWTRWLGDNAITRSTTHLVPRAGAHVVKLWAVDPGLVFERVTLLRPGAVDETFLGPPESPR